jgi:RNA 3'-terminal phosphate cyclase
LVGKNCGTAMSRLTYAVARKISRRGFHPDGGGLYLAARTQKNGAPSRSWFCRYTAPDGRRRKAGLGRYRDVLFARACALAAELREAASPLAPAEVIAEPHAEVFARSAGSQAANRSIIVCDRGFSGA